MTETLIPKTHMFDPNRRATMLIIHGIATSLEEAENIFTGKSPYEASVHYLVTLAGEVRQYVSESARAWHAGKSHWSGFSDINSLSIGIELEGQPVIKDETEFVKVTYEKAQMDALVSLAKGIIERHKILPHHVLGHQDIAPGRKFDPGPNFDWHFLAENGIGLWHDLKPQEDDFVITDQAEIKMFHLGLSLYGYASEAFDGKDFSEVIRAFQLHFLPWNVCGEVTAQSIEALGILLGKKNGKKF